MTNPRDQLHPTHQRYLAWRAIADLENEVRLRARTQIRLPVDEPVRRVLWTLDDAPTKEEQ